MAAAMPGTTQVADQDRAALSHLVVSSLHLALGATLTVLALVARGFPDLFPAAFSYGRLQPMAMTSVTIGWLVIGFLAAAYQMLPRLTGARLWNEPVATVAGWTLGALAAGGVVLIGLGLGDGGGPLGLPWWYDLLIALALLVPVAVVVQTLRHRTETGTYPTLWFIAGGVISLAGLALMTSVPIDGGLGEALQGVVFEAGFLTLWVTMLGAGAGWYVAVRASSNPLSNRQLAKAAYWSLLFAGIWAGPAQIAFAPVPDWLGPVGAALTLALPVAALSNALGIATTVDDAWPEIRRRPALGALAGALVLSLVVGVATSLGTFESASALLALTSYWDGVAYLALFGVGGLFLAAWAYQTLPAMSGRALPDTEAASRQVRWTVWFVTSTGLLMMLAGIAAGASTTGGAFGALGPDAWSEIVGAAEIFGGLAILTGIGALAAQLSFTLNVYRTLTSGAVTDQEILVEHPA